MKRIVEPEILDELPPDDSRAVASRRDLRKLNWIMRHENIFHDALVLKIQQAPRRIVELGAGDGSLLLGLARRFHTRWPDVRCTLVDQQKVATDETLAEFQKLGWSAVVAEADVFDWLKSAQPCDVMLANLFLHHFQDDKLTELLRLAAQQTKLFLACETRRATIPLAMSRMLWLYGCNTVTRNDAVISTRAGFAGQELSALWPRDTDWRLEERSAFVFTQFFAAQRL